MNRIRFTLSPTRSRPVNIFLGLVTALVALLLILALATYHPSDPSLNTAADLAQPHAVHNWIGLFGALLSDLMLQSLGIAAFLIPLWLAGLGWAWMRSRSGGSGWLRWLGSLLALAFVPTVLALAPQHWLWQRSLPLEGVTGRLLAGVLVAYLNLQGAWIVAGVLAAAGLYFASSLSIRTLWETLDDRRAQLAVWRDRWASRREAHAEREFARRQQPPEAAQPYIPGVAPEDLAAAAVEPPAEAPGNRPSRLAALFGRRRAAAGDPLEDIPAYRRVPFQPAEPEPEAEPARRSIWERPPAAAALDAAPQPQPAPIAAAAAAPVPVPVHPMRSSAPPPVAAPKAPPAPPQAPPAPPQVVAIQERADAEPRHAAVAPRTVSGFRLPPSTLLTSGDRPPKIREDQLREEAKVLEAKCAEFDVRGQVVAINPGPMVTTYEFKLENGVKYSRVTSLAEDLCLAMRAESILIERMPGKNTVGIQVPNHERETIHLREVIESEEFVKSRSRLALALGKDINGRIAATDLATMPHLLIAGSTGSGKSVSINSMIMSLLFRTTPDQVRLILVDPKRVELGMYEGVPHLFTPIITEPKLAANALRNAVREMERRYKVLATRSVRNIDQYNKLFEPGATPSLFGPEDGEEEQGPLPYLVIIIDELADLMMLDRANVEESITRLAQMARAVGIHLILATQRPSVDVITGLIKANVPTRISFRLSSKVDSRTILDTNGAEALLGRGDMLFLPPGTSRLQRLHAPYVSEKETAAVVDFWKAQAEADYAEGFLDAPREERTAVEGESGEDENDPLFDDAVRLVFEFGKASTSLLQRRLRIGYGRAAHLIDLMERDGLVGPADGSRPRELLKSPGWLHEVPAGIDGN